MLRMQGISSGLGFGLELLRKTFVGVRCFFEERISWSSSLGRLLSIGAGVMARSSLPPSADSCLRD